jgi:transcriptional regulator with XRE-family HTH domain
VNAAITVDLLETLKDKGARDQFLWDTLGPMLSRQMKAIRLSRGLTRRALARGMNVSQARVWYWEQERFGSKLTLRTLRAFAEFFDIGLIVRFVDWPTYLRWIASPLEAPPSFDPRQLEGLVA